MVRATARNYNDANGVRLDTASSSRVNQAMQIHIARDGQKFGPFSAEEVKARLASGELRATDLAWSEGRAEWSPLSAFPGISTASATPPPLNAPALPPPLRKVPQLLNPPPSGLAITSLVCGILSVTLLPLLTSIPAIVCGHVAQSRIKRAAGAIGGGGMAFAGMLIGYLSFALMIPIIAILAGIALPVFKEVQVHAKQTQSFAHAKDIALACRLYAEEHDGSFPKTLEELVPEFLPSRDIFICPLTGPAESMGYIYFGGKTTDPGENVLLVSKGADRRGKRIVVHVDGSGVIEKYTPELPAPSR